MQAHHASNSALSEYSFNKAKLNDITGTSKGDKQGEQARWAESLTEETGPRVESSLSDMNMFGDQLEARV